MIKNVIASYLTSFLNLVGIILWLGAGDWELGSPSQCSLRH
jgi:hypothetical protein